MAGKKDDLCKGIKVLGGKYILKVTPDKLCAYLVPNEKAAFPDKEAFTQLKEFLKTKGITFGLLNEPVWDEGILIVAKGKEPIPGENSYLEWFVKYKPEEIKDQIRVDLRERGLIRCVRQGQKIAKLHPPTPGVAGKNIFGEEIPPRPGEPLKIETNEWVAFKPEENVFYARKAGVLQVYGNRIEIQPEFYLNGDVNWDTGNIRFFGEKLTVSGDVKRGFKLEAEGQVEILGNVEDEAKIEVNGELLIEGLIHGERAIVWCGGNARLGAIEYAKVKVEKDLVITDYALQAELEVGGDVVCTEGVGAIIGGEARIKGNLFARILGSRAHVPTLVKVGCDEKILNQLELLKEKLVLLESNKKPLSKTLRVGLKMLQEGKLSPEKIKAYQSLKNKFEKLLALEKELLAQKKNLLKSLEALSRNKVVKVSEHVFAGVKIQIGAKTFTVAQDLPGGIFHLLRRQIRYLPLSQKEREFTSPQA